MIYEPSINESHLKNCTICAFTAFCDHRLKRKGILPTHGLSHRWSYLIRTTPNMCSHLQEIEDGVTMNLIPKLTGRSPPNELERTILGLPARYGGIGIEIITGCHQDFETSTEPLKSQILSQSNRYTSETVSLQISAKSESWRAKQDRLSMVCAEGTKEHPLP